MKRPKQIIRLKTLGPFTAKEIAVMSKAINTFSTSGHPMPDKSTIGGFSKIWVACLLRKAEKMLAERPEYKADLATIKKLIERLNRKSKL